MKSNYCKRSDINKAYLKGVNNASEKVTKTMLNITNNILKIDFNFSDDDLKKFNDKIVAVIMDINSEHSKSDNK